jgi:hypothetical protein
MGACRKKGPALHEKLRGEMAEKHDKLKVKAREVEDAEGDLIDANAVSNDAEVSVEDLLRDIAADLRKLDRSDPSLNAERAVFPNGFEAEIDPEGDEQLKVLPKLHQRLSVFLANAVVADAITKLDVTGKALSAALKAESEADAKVDSLFAEELIARRDVREQLESAYGRLRDLYKAKPAYVERFFLREVARRKQAEAPAKEPTGEAGGAAGEKKPE